jgi:hypothetical protein
MRTMIVRRCILGIGIVIIGSSCALAYLIRSHVKHQKAKRIIVLMNVYESWKKDGEPDDVDISRYIVHNNMNDIYYRDTNWASI